MRCLILTALLLGCSYHPQLPAPSEAAGRPVSYHRAHMPKGTFALARPATHEVYLTHRFEQLPPIVRAYIVFHELCHLEGNIAEEAADSCAFERMSTNGYLPASKTAELGLWIQKNLGPVRVGRLLEHE